MMSFLLEHATAASGLIPTSRAAVHFCPANKFPSEDYQILPSLTLHLLHVHSHTPSVIYAAAAFHLRLHSYARRRMLSATMVMVLW